MGILPIPRTHKNIFLKSKKPLPTLPVGEGLISKSSGKGLERPKKA